MRLRALALLLVLSACIADPREAPDTDASSPAEEVAAIAEEVWQRRLEQDPSARQREGLPVERLPDISYARAEEDAEWTRGVLARLEAIDPMALEESDRVTYDLLMWQSEMAVEGFPYIWHGSLLTPYSSPLRYLRPIFSGMPTATQEDLDAYLGLVGQVPSFVQAVRTLAVGKLERGLVVSQENLPAVIAGVEAVIRSAEEGPFHVDTSRLEGHAPEAVEAFRADLAKTVDDEINPALTELLNLVQDEWSSAAPEGVGASTYPGGEDYYRYLTRFSTTLDITPEQVQQQGFELVAELQAAMDEIQREVGFTGSRNEFRQHLDGDPRFYVDTPEEVGERLMAAANAMEAKLGDYFEVLPEAPYGVRRLHPSLEGSLTYGYYDAPTATEPSGFYNYNGSTLDQRSLLNAVGLALHELVPGHHFHIARQQESSLPDIRRHTFPTAFTEGWGSYASYLGLEAGVADDPYDRYGIYTLEIFLANRLVVDPGMNYFGWSLEQARDYMRENTFESETQIKTESLRYSTDMPAQALAYQMGKLKFLELRRRAEEALGERFDLRAFHEVLLGEGALPLAVVEKRVERYIARMLG